MSTGPGCSATLGDALAAADAETSAAVDRIDLGPGEYPGPFTADADNAVEIVGAGRGKTVLTAAGIDATVISLAAPASVLRSVTVRLGAGDGMTGVAAETAEDVAIEGGGTGATGFVGSALTRAAVDLGPGATGVRIRSRADPRQRQGPGLRNRRAGGVGRDRGRIRSARPAPTSAAAGAAVGFSAAATGSSGCARARTTRDRLASAPA